MSDRCKDCGQPIAWGLTPGGAKVPLEPAAGPFYVQDGPPNRAGGVRIEGARYKGLEIRQAHRCRTDSPEAIRRREAGLKAWTWRRAMERFQARPPVATVNAAAGRITIVLDGPDEARAYWVLLVQAFTVIRDLLGEP